MLERLWWTVSSQIWPHTTELRPIRKTSLTVLLLTFSFIVLKQTSNHTLYRFYQKQKLTTKNQKIIKQNLVNDKEKCAFLSKLIFFKAKVKYTNAYKPAHLTIYPLALFMIMCMQARMECSCHSRCVEVRGHLGGRRVHSLLPFYRGASIASTFTCSAILPLFLPPFKF